MERAPRECAEGRSRIRDSRLIAILLKFMRDEYIPVRARALRRSRCPDGKAYYRSKILEFTTLDLDPASIHKTGLAEVTRIHGRDGEAMRASGFKRRFPGVPEISA